MIPLISRASQALAVALLVLPILIGWLVTKPLIYAWDMRNQDIARLERLSVGYRSAISDRAVVEARLYRLRQRVAEQAFLLEGASPTVASAALQAEVKRTVEQHGGEVKSVLGLAPTEENGFQRIGLRLDLRASLESLQRILVTIETSVPFIFVDVLTARAPEVGSANALPREPVLTIRLDLSGYMRTAAS